MARLEDGNDDLLDEVVRKLVAFVLFCSGCVVVPATSVIFWLTLRHNEIGRKPINWSIVNLAVVDFVFGVGVVIQSGSLVLHDDTLCEISGVLTNSMMTANLFSLAAIAAQFDGINRLQEKMLLRLSSGEISGDSLQPAFTVSSTLLINVGIWFYVLLAAVPLIVTPTYGPHAIGLCASLPKTLSVLYSCNLVFVLSGIFTCSAIIAHYYQRLRNVAVYGISRRISDISETDVPPKSIPNDVVLALRFLRISFLSLIGSRAGWFIAEVLFRTMPNPFPLYVVRLFYMLTPLSSLINQWLVLLSLEQYHQGIRGKEIASADRCGGLLEDAEALKRLSKIDSNRLHPDSFKHDWRMQPASLATTRYYSAPARPLGVHRRSFSQPELLVFH